MHTENYEAELIRSLAIDTDYIEYDKQTTIRAQYTDALWRQYIIDVYVCNIIATARGLSPASP